MKIVSDEGIVERILSAAGHGQAFDGFVENGETGKQLLSPYLEGDASIVSDVSQGLGGLGAAGLRDLTVADFVRRITASLGSAGGALASQLNEAIGQGGLGDRSVADLLDDDR